MLERFYKFYISALELIWRGGDSYTKAGIVVVKLDLLYIGLVVGG